MLVGEREQCDIEFYALRTSLARVSSNFVVINYNTNFLTYSKAKNRFFIGSEMSNYLLVFHSLRFIQNPTYNYKVRIAGILTYSILILNYGSRKE